MDSPLLSSVARLSNSDLLAGVKRLAVLERQVAAVLIAHLGELDDRRLYLAEGCSSLFSYCTQVLHLSEHAAYHRIEAARAARKFPVLLERLADGSVTLTTIRLLAPHLTPENHQDLLERARHQSRRAVEELAARLRPLPAIPAMIRRLPARGHRPASSAMPPDEPHSVRASVSGARPATLTPLSPESYKLQCTVSPAPMEKLRQAQALLRHQVPDGDVATIIDRALAVLLEQVAKQKVAATDRPRGQTEGTKVRGSRHIPNAVKRAVWLRDGGQCAFVGEQGRRCSEDGFLEFHHTTPHAVGGEATADNIQLRCRAHNGYEAELYFGSPTSMKVKEARAPYGTLATHGGSDRPASHCEAPRQLAPDRVRTETAESHSLYFGNG